MRVKFTFVNYLILSATFLCAVENNAVHAALGETKDELLNRFGQPAMVLDDPNKVAPAETIFAWTTHPDYKVVYAYMLNGRSALESYTLRRDATGPDDTSLTDLLEASARGEEWKPITGAQLAGANAIQKEIATLSNDVPGFQHLWMQRKSGSEAYLSSEKPLRNFYIKSKEWAEALRAK